MMLLADAVEFFKSGSWETVVTVVGSLGVVGIPVAGFAWWFAKRHYRGQLKSAVQSNKQLHEQLAAANATATAARRTAALLQKDNEQKAALIQQQQTKIENALAAISQAGAKEVQYLREGHRLWVERNKLLDEQARSKRLNDTLTAQATDGDAQLATVKTELDKRRADLDRSERRIRRAIKLDGYLWMAKALQRVPKFRPQSERRQTIISVLNLKGGVGKTTITANLGVALARRGLRVLFLDMDLQGSLTDLLLPDDKIRQLNANRLLMQHFLEAVSLDSTVKIVDYIQEVCRFRESGGSVHLVGASDNLGYTELSLTLRWLLKQGQRDNRFLLRKTLHMVSVAKRFDVVLIDCPPLVNMSCVNALAACDGILVPVTLDARATERVPVLLKRVIRSEKFRKNINHDLKVAGIVANRTYRETLTAAESAAWEFLGTRCRDAVGAEVRRMEPTIPAWNEIRDSENLLDPSGADGRSARVFDELAAELERELPSECRRPAAALS